MSWTLRFSRLLVHIQISCKWLWIIVTHSLNFNISLFILTIYIAVFFSAKNPPKLTFKFKLTCLVGFNSFIIICKFWHSYFGRTLAFLRLLICHINRRYMALFVGKSIETLVVTYSCVVNWAPLRLLQPYRWKLWFFDISKIKLLCVFFQILHFLFKQSYGSMVWSWSWSWWSFWFGAFYGFEALLIEVPPIRFRPLNRQNSLIYFHRTFMHLFFCVAIIAVLPLMNSFLIPIWWSAWRPWLRSLLKSFDIFIDFGHFLWLVYFDRLKIYKAFCIRIVFHRISNFQTHFNFFFSAFGHFWRVVLVSQL